MAMMLGTIVDPCWGDSTEFYSLMCKGFYSTGYKVTSKESFYATIYDLIEEAEYKDVENLNKTGDTWKTSGVLLPAILILHQEQIDQVLEYV